MPSNKLKFNPTKTGFLWAATTRRQPFIPSGPITLSGADIVPSCFLKLLSVYLDDGMSASTPTNKVVSPAFLYLRQIKSIRRCLPADAEKSLVNAFMVSRLDYWTVSMPTYHKRRLIEYSQSSMKRRG